MSLLAGTYRAVEALAVVVVVEGLHPAVAGLDGEATREALGGEQLVPIWRGRALDWKYTRFGEHMNLCTPCQNISP